MGECWTKAKCDRCGRPFSDGKRAVMFTVMMGEAVQTYGSASGVRPGRSFKLCQYCGAEARETLAVWVSEGGRVGDETTG